MNSFEISSYPGDNISIKNEILTYKVNKDWRLVELKNQQGKRKWLPAGLRILGENETAKDFKINDEVIYSPREIINKNNSAITIKDNSITSLGNTLETASITFKYEPGSPQKYYNGKLLVKFGDASSYILPAVIESDPTVLTGNYKLKLWYESQGQANIYFSEYADTWLSIIDSDNNFKGALNLGIIKSGIHIDTYFGLSWDQVASKLLRCRPATPPLDRVANLEIQSTNDFVFGRQFENKTLEDIGVYGPAPKSSKSLNGSFKQDFFLYRLPPSQETPENISFYGVYLPEGSTAVTSDGSFISGPKAVLIYSKNFDIEQDVSNRFILPSNAEIEIINPGDILNLEVPSYSQSEIRFLPFPDPKVIQQKPAAYPTLRRDRNKLKIITDTSIINYYEFIRLNSTIIFNVDFNGNARSGKWLLYTPTGKLVATSYIPPGLSYGLSAKDIERIRGVYFRSLVENIGRSSLVFGTWKLKYEVDTYFDFITFEVSQEGKPKEIIEDAETTESYYNIRDIAETKRPSPPNKSPTIIDELNGIKKSVKLIDKASVDTTNFYRFQLKQPTLKLEIGQKGWIKFDQITACLSWDFFLSQLRKFESRNNNLSLDKRITKLRQICHTQDLIFDAIIPGISRGEVYQDTRSFIRSEWQILEPALQKVRVPDGSIVDIYHLLVGLDVLLDDRPQENFELQPGDALGGFLFKEFPDSLANSLISLFNLIPSIENIDIGSNYAAATWSGDIGAGAMDALVGVDDTWEGKNGIPNPQNQDRSNYLDALIEHYYSSRAPKSDLLGDLDAWGMNELRSNKSYESIEKLLRSYYENINLTNMTTVLRENSIKLFLLKYGFNTSNPLVNQIISRNKIRNEIKKFADVWSYFITFNTFLEKLKQDLTGSELPDLDDIATLWDKIVLRRTELVQELILWSWYVDPMTDRFLNWLDGLASDYGVSIEE